jgi:hypothetical protein
MHSLKIICSLFNNAVSSYIKLYSVEELDDNE